MTATDTQPGAREARLIPAFSGHYPGIEPDVWLPAAALTDAVLARARTGSRPSDPRRRVLDPTHFDFRGGSP